MAESASSSWQEARKEPFEAFGVLYYPLFRFRADLPTVLDDIDMAWAVTANTNLRGTGYTLSQMSITTLASYHHAIAALAKQSAFLPLATAADNFINPLSDIERLVPNVTAKPMYPDFPQQVMQIPEAQFRYDQACHYLSTYGVESIAGLLGLDVTVGKGWLPKVKATEKTREDKTLVAPKVLHVLVTLEDLQDVVAARLARATRMHPAEIATTLIAFGELGAQTEAGVFPKIAFHENMMELIRTAAWSDSATLERVAAGFAQHPGDLLKATMYLLDSIRKEKPGTTQTIIRRNKPVVRISKGKAHLRTRQKKGLCRAFEHFSTMAIARNIADAGKDARQACNYLSVARFGGPNLRDAVELVNSGRVRSWASELESLWDELDIISNPRQRKSLQGYFSRFFAGEDQPIDGLKDVEQLWRKLLDHYGMRPGMLFRSIGRLVKAGCPHEMLFEEIESHVESYALPTIVRTITTMSEPGSSWRMERKGHAGFSIKRQQLDVSESNLRKLIRPVLRRLLIARMRTLETPLKGKRIHLDTAGVSLVGSVLVPNEVGDTGTAWPPVGMAFDLPADKTVRFFTFWDDRSKRVDVDLHFVGRSISGENVHIGWNASFRGDGLLTSGDITTSLNSVEYLDADMAVARKNVRLVVQEQHIYSGAYNWKDIKTCYSGATIVGDKSRDVHLLNRKNLIFRDDLTGEGTRLAYAVINFPNHYVRILRGADLPLGDVGFSLGDYLEALFEAQEVTLVSAPEDAELRVCVGRSDDPGVISLFDEGFFIG